MQFQKIFERPLEWDHQKVNEMPKTISYDPKYNWIILFNTNFRRLKAKGISISGDPKNIGGEIFEKLLEAIEER